MTRPVLVILAPWIRCERYYLIVYMTRLVPSGDEHCGNSFITLLLFLLGIHIGGKRQRLDVLFDYVGRGNPVLVRGDTGARSAYVILFLPALHSPSTKTRPTKIKTCSVVVWTGNMINRRS